MSEFIHSNTRRKVVEKWSKKNELIRQLKEWEAVVVPLPNSMHAGQVFLLTKVLAKQELAFYDFSTGNPVEKWRESRVNDTASDL